MLNPVGKTNGRCTEHGVLHRLEVDFVVTSAVHGENFDAARNKSLRRGAVYLGVHEHAGGAKPSASGKAVVMSRVSE